MKKLLVVSLLLMLSSLAFGQANLPPCDPNNLPPNCTDYFGVANWANSPLPAGAITGFTVVFAGTGYVNPVVVITDTTGTGASAGTVTVVGGAITAIAVAGGGTGYIAPQVTVVDVGLNGTLATPTCGAIGQPACGSGAMVTAMIGAPLTVGTGLRKFVDPLPDLKSALATPDTTTFPGADYYVIALMQYTSKMHADLPPTTLRGYCQLIGTATTCTPSYLGPVILASMNRPVRVLFKNLLPTGAGGNLFIPVDTTYMGAGPPYAQNRGTLHLHGGATPWISDGTPHQWTAPAGEAGPKKGDSTQNVPDMWFDATGNLIASCAGQPTCAVTGATNDPGDGAMTFFWTNQQGGRLMFYHDHALGLTRLNVYAGEAAGYLLVDPKEEDALAAATVPGTVTATPDLAHLIPLVIQDKTFVPSAAQLAAEDPTWTAGGFGTTPGVANPGDLWFPHVYTPNQNPADVGGSNAFGRWDYGPWTLPGNQTVLLAATPTVGDVTIPCTSSAFPNLAVNCPIIPNPSGTPESFMDTPLVNGKAYPVLHVAPEAYRFQILSAGNDRSWNLQWYVADPTVVTPDGRTNTEVKMVPAIQPAAGSLVPLCTTVTPITNTSLFIGLATAVLDASGNPINGTGLPAGCWPNFGSASQAAGIPIQQTMWAADGRAGGAPDPTTAGPPFIQIGTEGGLLPAPVVIPSMPTGYEANPRSVTITNVSVHGLWLGTAERADAIVDFTKFAGKTLILYNDAPTPAPAGDSRIDYFTSDGDQTIIGGAPNTLPGFGPNTRTIMQVVVDQAPTGKPFSLPALTAALPGLFAQTQPVPIVPEPTYPPASGGYSAIPTYSLITDATLTFFPIGSTTPVTYTDERKTIQELFTLDYGRMNATLGVELPLTNFLTQTTIPLGYIDPVTEVINQGDTQLWHITHNGVDTHFIHFHLFNVQVINRSAWDGTKRPPDQNELGWKDTVRMNPLEDILVALKPIQPLAPFPLRDSYRLMDVTMPAGPSSNCPDPAALTPNSPTPGPCSIFTNRDPVTNNPAQTDNGVHNYGWEYVWHCHILGHEENDMMRAIAFNVPPEAPSNLTVAAATTGLNLSWIDNSASETGFTLERADDSGFTKNPVQIPVSAITGSTDINGQGITWGGTQTYNDTGATGTGPYFYRVQAIKPEASYWATGVITSAWSNTASFAATSGAPFASVSPTTLAFGNVALLATSAPQTLTLSNTGNASFTYTTSKLGPNPADFAVVNTCGGSVLANSRCTLSVTFTPTFGGSESAVLLISTSDPLNPTLTVSLTGTTGLPLLTITANNETMRYGSIVPAITFSYTPPNPVGVTPPTCTTLATKTSPVGTYPIACTGATGNYTFTYMPGTVSVTPAPLTIWASNATMPLGGFPPVPPSTTFTLPVITPSYVGFVAGDTAATLAIAPNALPTCSTTVTLTTPVGKYANATSCSGAVDANYTISYVKGAVTVAVSPLVITGPSPTMTYGGPVPSLTPIYNPAPPIGLTTPAVCSTSATTTSPVGTYPVTCSGAVDPNYTIGYVAGTLTVVPAPLVITAPSPTMPYGGPLPATLTPTYASFVAGDTAASLTPQPTCTTTATTASPVGTYPVTCTGAVDANYTISYVAGTLTVNPAVVTVTASSASMTYGGTPPAITPAYSGFVLGQTSSVLAPAPTCSTTATSTSPVSPPTIPSTCSGAAAPNYTFNYVPGAVTVIGAPLTITANNASKVYGTALTLPGTAFTVTGLLNTDKVTSVTLTSPGTLVTAAVGPYAITPSAAVGTGLGNYTITYNTTGTLTVTPAALTITAKPASKIYGQVLTFVGTEFIATGLLNADTVSSVTLSSAGTPATAVVGTSPITPSAAAGTGLGNYTITYANGTLTVTKASTATTITSNLPSPAIVGQVVTVSFGVAPQFTQIPTGTVTVRASTGETCSAALAAGVGSCPLTFFTGGPRTLTATYAGDTNFVGSVSPAANQVVSGISLSTSSLLFGDQLVGTTSSSQTVTISNVGITTLTNISFAWSANFSDSTNCGTTLAPGRSCRINVRFRPTATGVLTGTLTITDSDPTSPQIVTLTGTGVQPVANLTPSSQTFGPIPRRTTSAPFGFTLSNAGTAPLTINNISIGGTNPGQFAISSNTCGASLAVGASCTINVTFSSRNAGTFNASLRVTDNAPGSPQTASLTGTAQ